MFHINETSMLHSTDHHRLNGQLETPVKTHMRELRFQLHLARLCRVRATGRKLTMWVATALGQVILRLPGRTI